MKRILYIMAICCAASLFAQDNYKNYYWIGQYEGTMTGLTSWSEDETGYDNPVTISQPKGSCQIRRVCRGTLRKRFAR